MGYKADFTPLIDALTSTGIPVGHGNGFKNGGAYLVWHEAERVSENADNRPVYQYWKVRVYFFTPEEYDDRIDKIEAALIENEIDYEGPFVEYDPEEKRTRYRYECEVVI
ncbi:MAG: hypothetical protein NC084_11975 [Bacteroides sp.]|nr:hypothetical protein [Eubacterium sp.]MCM1419302.1 hypothetical protein [Roseburia sp.]MCM1463410.1 hypothetical protein [Bacteroides sp.]